MVLFCATALLLALAVPGARGSALAPPPVQPYGYRRLGVWGEGWKETLYTRMLTIMELWPMTMNTAASCSMMVGFYHVAF